MKIFLFTLLMLSTCLAYTQVKEETKTPQWALLMYQEMESETSDVQKVILAYDEYYANRLFKKNKHTWHYKMWLRDPGTYISNTKAHGLQQDAERELYINKRNTVSKKSGTSWSPIGPIQNHDWNGNVIDRLTHVSSITSAPSDTNIMFCGTEAGEVYKSIDAGNTWLCISMGPELVMSEWDGVTAMAIHPTNPNIVHVAGEGHLYKSVDGGLNWTLLLAGCGKAFRMVIHPQNPNIIIWATTIGLYRSTDGGTTINAIMTKKCYDIDVHPNQPDSMYTIINNNLDNPEFYVSADGGATWTIKTTGFYASAAIDRKLNGAAIAVSPSNPNIIYTVLLGDSTATDEGLIGILKSTDGGESWFMPVGYCGDPYTSTHINYCGWSDQFMCEFMISPTNPDHLIVGTKHTYKSTDGGVTFQRFGSAGGNIYIHADIRDIYQAGNKTWITTDGGIKLSTDFYTNDFNNMAYGLHGQDFWGFDIGWHEDVMVGGLFHNGVTAHYKNYPDRFNINLAGGEPQTGYVNPSQNKLVYYYEVGSLIPDNIGQAPTTIVQRPFAPNESPWPAYRSGLFFHPNCYKTFYQGTGTKLWKTTDGGATLTMVKDFKDNTIDSVLHVAEIAIASENPDIMYVTRAKCPVVNVPQLWKTIDAGLNWTQLSLPVLVAASRVLISIDPTNSDNIWIGFASGLEYMCSIQNNMNGQKAYKSTDGGQTWINLTSPVLDGEVCHDIIHVAGTDGGVYFCTQNSVYYRNNSMTDWDQDNLDLPFYVSTNVGKVWYKHGKIRLGTYGRGVWENDLYELPAAPIARIMVDELEKNVILSSCHSTATDSFYFDDYSFMEYSETATNTWSWQFPTGNPSSSNLKNPAVYFGASGVHTAFLTITDINGLTDTDTLNVSIQSIPLPSLVQEGFESGVPPVIRINNYDNDHSWTISTPPSGGYGLSSYSIVMDNYSYNKPGEHDEFDFILDFSNSTSPWLQFDVAYSPYSITYGDTLEVLVSVDCGLSFQSVYYKGPAALATVPIGVSYPNASTWRTDSIDLTSYMGTQDLLVVFRNINGFGDLLYIDNINIGNQSVVSVIEQGKSEPSFTIFPNPIKAGEVLSFVSNSKDPCKFMLYDARGKQIMYQETMQHISIPKNIAMGIYYYKAAFENSIFKGKIVIR
ncbi:MAG: hypothetical protein COB15_01195 [Flavobacteriales bacterium]|nr:MAG: hypothetical protein COB15_01195 [Flavobacteriales bacterium]